jgi:hypothetical protein
MYPGTVFEPEGRDFESRAPFHPLAEIDKRTASRCDVSHAVATKAVRRDVEQQRERSEVFDCERV